MRGAKKTKKKMNRKRRSFPSATEMLDFRSPGVPWTLILRLHAMPLRRKRRQTGSGGRANVPISNKVVQGLPISNAMSPFLMSLFPYLGRPRFWSSIVPWIFIVRLRVMLKRRKRRQSGSDGRATLAISNKVAQGPKFWSPRNFGI